MSGRWTLVGVDCATQEDRMGLCRMVLDEDGKLHVERLTLGTAGESPAANVCNWIAGQESFVLAFDAPLGWPKKLGKRLASHSAGEALDTAADELFRRHTDRFVHKSLGKLPPEVGADRIARTTRAALGLLAEIRAQATRPIPLSWCQASEAGAIEVYPAATLITRGLPTTGYKTDTAAGRKTRARILERIESEVEMSAAHELMIEDPNLLDALICALAAADFARGLCEEPPDLAHAKKEGFIWFRSKGQRSLAYDG
jgi:predicted RNase H-like nuclease